MARKRKSIIFSDDLYGGLATNFNKWLSLTDKVGGYEILSITPFVNGTKHMKNSILVLYSYEEKNEESNG